MDTVKELYKNRSQRVIQLKKEGYPIFGYLCLYPPIEMLTALDIVPYRILGDMKEPITKADTYLPTVVCPFLRSVLDLGLKAKYEFLDGIVTAHICDVGSSMSSIWNYAIKTPFSYHLDTPHTTHETALEQAKGQMQSFKKALEKYTGKKITNQSLKKAITLHNQQRMLVRRLYELKKHDPPLVTGVETLMIIKVLQSLPVNEGNTLLTAVIQEIEERAIPPEKKSARLLVWGSIIDSTPLLDMIEGLDANIVIDDTCVGSRAFFQDVPLTPNLIDGLAKHYLADIKCPRTFNARDYYAKSRQWGTELQERFGYLGDYAKKWNINGVVLESVRYCDTHGYEVPGIKDYFSEIGLPTIYLEHDYTEGALAQLRTRMQGFLEIIN